MSPHRGLALSRGPIAAFESPQSKGHTNPRRAPAPAQSGWISGAAWILGGSAPRARPGVGEGAIDRKCQRRPGYLYRKCRPLGIFCLSHPLRLAWPPTVPSAAPARGTPSLHPDVATSPRALDAPAPDTLLARRRGPSARPGVGAAGTWDVAPEQRDPEQGAGDPDPDPRRTAAKTRPDRRSAATSRRISAIVLRRRVRTHGSPRRCCGSPPPWCAGAPPGSEAALRCCRSPRAARDPGGPPSTSS
jgi:hypothetical protein